MKKLFISLLLPALFISCGTSEKEKTSTEDTTEKVITDWARPGSKGKMTGAYFVYKNELSETDTLLSASSPQAMMTQIHESFTTEDGLSGMREMKQITVEPNQELILKPGGLHVMLMNLKDDVTTDNKITIELTFSQAGKVNLTLPVLSSN